MTTDYLSIRAAAPWETGAPAKKQSRSRLAPKRKRTDAPTYDTKRQIDYCQTCKKPECDNCLARLMVGQIPEDKIDPVTGPITSDPCPGCALSPYCKGTCRRAKSYRKWRREHEKPVRRRA